MQLRNLLVKRLIGGFCGVVVENATEDWDKKWLRKQESNLRPSDSNASQAFLEWLQMPEV